MTTPLLTLQQRDVWLMRLYYFLFYAANGIIIPFLNLFYSELGLTGAQIGIVAAVSAALTLVVAPLWTRWSEHTGRAKEVLQIALLLTAVGCLWLGYQHLFMGIIIVTIFRALVGAGIMPLSDAIAIAVAKLAGVGYGGVRVWGSVGWIAMGLFTGLIIEYFGWWVLFGMAGAIYLAMVLTLMPLGSAAFINDVRPERAAVVSSDLIRRIGQQPLMLGVAAMMLLVGVFNSGVLQFESVFLAGLGATKPIIGLIGILGAIVELPMMIWSDRLIRRYGAYNILILGLALYIVVRVLVVMLPTIPLIMFTKALTGMAFSFYTIALISFFSEHVEQREQRTVMALYNVTLVSLIGMIAPPLSGLIYDATGGRWLYLVGAVGYVLAVGALLLARRYASKRKRSQLAS